MAVSCLDRLSRQPHRRRLLDFGFLVFAFDSQAYALHLQTWRGQDIEEFQWCDAQCTIPFAKIKVSENTDHFTIALIVERLAGL